MRLPLDRFLEDDCRDNTMRPASVFDLYRRAIEQVSNFPPPTGLDLQHTRQAYFNDHTPDHLRRAQRYAEELIGKSNLNLTCCEALLLLLAIWTHDVGMLFKLSPNESDEYARSEHHERVAQILSLIERANHLPALPAGLTSLLTAITRAHRRIVDISTVIPFTTVNQNPIRVRLLAAILRVSDASDIDNQRSPEAIFELFEQAMPASSKDYWRRNFLVTGVNYDAVSSSIWVYILPSPEQLGSVIRHLELCEWLREELTEELRSVASVFREYNIPLFHVQLIDQASGKILELERPPSEAGCFTITMRQSNLNATNLDELERTLRQHPGTYKIAVEVRTNSGSLFGTIPHLSTDGSDGTINAINDVLGDAVLGCELQSEPVNVWRFTN